MRRKALAYDTQLICGTKSVSYAGTGAYGVLQISFMYETVYRYTGSWQVSIYSKPLDKLTFDDIKALKDEGAQENIRLEFKGSHVAKHEMLKKLCSFANTYGGYLVIGIEEDGKGNIKSLSGVPLKNSYDQTIVQWCWTEIYPPIRPVISPAVPHKDDPGKVFYVIHVPESQESPHFINGRRGAYVRVMEYSQRFEPRLATYEEIRLLADRRERAKLLRDSIVQGATERCEYTMRTWHRNSSSDEYERAARRTILVTPTFTPTPIARVETLFHSAKFNTLGVRGFSQGYPRYGSGPKAVPGGIAFFDRREDGYTEIQSTGLVFYRELVTEDWDDHFKKGTIDSKYSAVMFIKVCQYASQLYRLLGFYGNVTVRAIFSSVKGRCWAINHDYVLRNSEIVFERQLPAAHLGESLCSLATEYLFEVHWALGVSDHHLAKEIVGELCRI